MQENDRQDVQDDDYIDIIGANENNLRNVSVRIPRNKLVVITGLSGSGKIIVWLLTPYMPKVNVGIWRRFQPMRANLSERWIDQM